MAINVNRSKMKALPSYNNYKLLYKGNEVWSGIFSSYRHN
jgi:hypothetical protein